MRHKLQLKLRLFIMVLLLVGPIWAQAVPSGLSSDQLQQIQERLGESRPSADAAMPPQVGTENTRQNFPVVPREKSIIEKDFLLKPQQQFTVFTSDDGQPKPPVKDDAIRQFGYEFFEQGPPQVGYQNIPISADYILGPGDNIVIRLWGLVERKFDVVIDKNGKVFFPKIGSLYISGTRFGDVRKILKRAFGKHYVNFEINVSMGRLRTIKVFILGEVHQPGAYDISSLANLMMALKVAGGPKRLGSLRNISIKRRGKHFKTVDLYQYLLEGKERQDVKLRDFDTIYVPVIGDVVKVNGRVKRPAIYELSKKDNLHSAVFKLAGGFLNSYYGKRIQIHRVQEGERVVVKDLIFETDMKHLTKSNKVQSGDIITVLPIDEKLHKTLEIRGHVKREGIYEHRPGMTVEKLVDRAQGFEDGVYKKKVDIYRYISPDQRKWINVDFSKAKGRNTPLKEYDIVHIYAKRQIFGEASVSVSGDVTYAGRQRLLKDARLSDVVFRAEPLYINADTKIDLFRSEPEELHISIPALKLIKGINGKDDVKLRPNDAIHIRNKKDAMQLRHVKLQGEFRYPGTYYVKKGERLSDVIRRAGGLTESGFFKGMRVYRKSVLDLQNEGQGRILEEERKRVIFDQTRIVKLNESYASFYANSIKYLQERILANQGRVIIQSASLDTLQNSANDIVLQDGDEIIIPARPKTVQLVGGVQKSSSVLFDPNKSLQDYINELGGYTEFADSSDILVIKPSGLVLKGSPKIEIGDTIYVPERVRVSIDWFDVLTKVAQSIFYVASSMSFIRSL